MSYQTLGTKYTQWSHFKVFYIKSIDTKPAIHIKCKRKKVNEFPVCVIFLPKRPWVGITQHRESSSNGLGTGIWLGFGSTDMFMVTDQPSPDHIFFYYAHGHPWGRGPTWRHHFVNSHCGCPVGRPWPAKMTGPASWRSLHDSFSRSYPVRRVNY